MSEAAGVSTSVSVDDGVTGKLARLAFVLGHLDPALDEIGASNVTETQMRFEDEESPEGEPWKGLATATLAKRGRESADGEARILRYRAELYDSLSHKVESGRAVRVGVSKVYGRIHQLGGMTGRKRLTRIEARPYLGVSQAGRLEIEQILNDHVSRGGA